MFHTRVDKLKQDLRIQIAINGVEKLEA